MLGRMPTVERELITTGQAAELLNVSHSTVARAARRGELPYVQQLPGSKGAYLFDPDVIEAERERRLERALQTVTALEGP